MNLGEKIYELRNENNFSQGALADALQVSRQSISKWENNMAVPDLDKLIKLCDIFEVSLDELVGREEFERNTNVLISQSPTVAPHKISAYVLLGVTILGAIITLVTAPPAIYLCIPLLICTIICFKVKKHAWYWCVWAVYLSIYLYLLFGIAGYVMQIAEAIFMVIMTFLTYKSLTDIKFNMRKELRLLLLAVYIIFVFGTIVGTWFIHYSGISSELISTIFFDEWVYVVINFIKMIVLGIGMIHTVCLIREAKENK